MKAAVYTYRLKVVVKTVLEPALESKANMIEMINDQYLRCSQKSRTRLSRGEGEKSPTVHIKSVDQRMLNSKECDSFRRGSHRICSLKIVFLKI